MILAGDTFGAAEARRLGLVNRVVLPDRLEAATMELAGRPAARSPLAPKTGKEGVNGLRDVPGHRGPGTMDDPFPALCATEDATEGVQAFPGGRKPVCKERRRFDGRGQCRCAARSTTIARR